MNKYLVLMICGFLLAGQVLAITPEGQALNDRAAEINKRANAFLLEAESRAIEQCDTTQIVVPFQSISFSTKSEIIIDVTVSIEWSGGCVDGKRDGEGVLGWTMERVIWGVKSVQKRQAGGRLVKGQRLGLWCQTYNLQVRGRNAGSDSGCSVFAGHANPLTGNFRKQPDGTWQEYSDDLPTGTTLVAGALEAQSAKVFAAADAGKSGMKADLVGQNMALNELVRGSKIVFALSSVPVSLKDKRVALVLSSNTIKELELFRRERQALITASSGLTGDAAKYRAEFIAASNPDRLLLNVLKTLRRNTKIVELANDLVGLQKGKFDYAFIFDWRDDSRLDLLGNYDSLPVRVSGQKDGFVACESLYGFLINPDLKVVKYLSESSTVGCTYQSDKDLTGDTAYMRTLVGHY